ncbi:MAG TPA: hypothetical protein VFG04_25045 [Planctomycetaceae bacterium]|jgi:hypothetical protein|nr:hypothetical protein [Planctomycetaceae bacterium]
MRKPISPLVAVLLVIAYVASIGPAYKMPGIGWRGVVYWPIWEIAFKSRPLFNALCRYIYFFLDIR